MIAVFEDFAQELHSFCEKTLSELGERRPELRRPFHNTAFGSMTFNFGPVVCTQPHRDMMNLSWGWCSVTALGNYAHPKGGHLVLWDVGVVIQFPPIEPFLFHLLWWSTTTPPFSQGKGDRASRSIIHPVCSCGGLMGFSQCSRHRNGRQPE